MGYELMWKIHAILMSVSFLSMLCGIIVSVFWKKKKWRYNTHKRLGIIAAISGAAAFIIAVVMVQIFTGVHFTSFHKIIGGIATILLIITPILGLRIRKAPNKKIAKRIHRTFGIITVVLMAFTILLGLVLTGIIYLPLPV